jgi:hypothetical protein
MAMRLLAFHAGSRFTSRRFLALISVTACVDLKAIVWLEGIGKLKNIEKT